MWYQKNILVLDIAELHLRQLFTLKILPKCLPHHRLQQACLLASWNRYRSVGPQFLSLLCFKFVYWFFVTWFRWMDWKTRRKKIPHIYVTLMLANIFRKLICRQQILNRLWKRIRYLSMTIQLLTMTRHHLNLCVVDRHRLASVCVLDIYGIICLAC